MPLVNKQYFLACLKVIEEPDTIIVDSIPVATTSHELLATRLTEDCQICQHDLKEPVKTPCNHVYCKLCLVGWLKDNNTCPACRRELFDAVPDRAVPLQGGALLSHNFGLTEIQRSIMDFHLRQLMSGSITSDTIQQDQVFAISDKYLPRAAAIMQWMKPNQAHFVEAGPNDLCEQEWSIVAHSVRDAFRNLNGSMMRPQEFGNILSKACGVHMMRAGGLWPVPNYAASIESPMSFKEAIALFLRRIIADLQGQSKAAEDQKLLEAIAENYHADTITLFVEAARQNKYDNEELHSMSASREMAQINTIAAFHAALVARARVRATSSLSRLQIPYSLEYIVQIHRDYCLSEWRALLTGLRDSMQKNDGKILPANILWSKLKEGSSLHLAAFRAQHKISTTSYGEAYAGNSTLEKDVEHVIDVVVQHAVKRGRSARPSLSQQIQQQRQLQMLRLRHQRPQVQGIQRQRAQHPNIQQRQIVQEVIMAVRARHAVRSRA